MEKIIEYLKLNLNVSNYYVSSEKFHYFEFDYNNIVKCRLEIKKIYKIKNPKLSILNSENFSNISDSHLNLDGTACFGLNNNIVLKPLELILKIGDWCETLYKRNLGLLKHHNHGYRHEFAGIVEEYFSKYSIPLLKKYVYKVNEHELFKIARKNYFYKNLSKEFLKKNWENIKENWDEKMS